MTRTRRLLLTLAATGGLVAAGAASAQSVKLPAKQVALSADHFHDRILVTDDPLDVETVISSERGFQTGRNFFTSPTNDNHLRAVVDKRTGATRFEVRQSLTYMGPVRGYAEVAYQTAQWPVRAPTIKIRDNGGYCFLIDAPEMCREEIAFDVSEVQLRHAATRPDAWIFKFSSPAGHEHRAAITSAEIAGLLKAVDGYRHALPAAQTAADIASGG